jgi:ferric-dicitrate binding protein FerR (iron transport regulator)
MKSPCPEEETWLALYSGELDEARTEQSAAHLQECTPCQDEFDRLCRLGAGLRGAFGEIPRARAIRRRRLPPPARGSGRRVLTLVAAALLVAAVGLVLRARPSTPVTAAPVFQVAEVPPPPDRPSSPSAPAFPREQRPIDDFTTTKFLPSPAPPGPATEPELPPPAPAEPRRTQLTIAGVSIATVERPGGSQPLLDGQGVKGRGVVHFADGTRMDLSEKTSIARISDRGGASGTGIAVELAEGTLAIEAAHQPTGRAMVIATPHGEARILGTTLRLSVDPDSTRLDVLEGKVRLSRPGAAATDVIGGHFAVAAEGVELAPRPHPRMVVEPVFRFSFEDGKLPRAFTAGIVERGPERSGSRFSLAGVLDPGSTAGGRVALSELQAGKGLFPYSEDLVLSFDYWADDAVRTLDLLVWSRAQQISFGTTVWETPREQWVHIAVPLRDFGGGGPDRALHLRPGESVPTLWIQTGQTGGKLVVDNLELARIYGPPGKAKDGRR